MRRCQRQGSKKILRGGECRPVARVGNVPHPLADPAKVEPSIQPPARP